MSSQKDTKPSSSKGTQQTLLSFFGKAPTSTPNASARPKPPSNATPSTSSTKPKPKSTPASSSSSSAIKPGGPSKTPLAARHLAPSNSNSGASTPAGSSTSGGALTSEGDDDDDGMDLDAVATGPSSDLPSSSSRKPTTKRVKPVDSDEDEEDEDSVVAFKKKFTAKSKARIADSDDEEDDDVVVMEDKDSKKKKVVVPAPKTKAQPPAKKSKKDNDDGSAYSGSAAGSGSDDYFDDDLDDFLVDDDEEPKAVSKPKPIATAKKSSSFSKKPVATSSRPVMKSSGSGSGGIAGIKTSAEAAKLKEKEKKASNEKTFSFLIDPKDADGIRPGEEGYDPRTLYIPRKAWDQFTPFEVQFWEIKQHHYDTVLFFQKGKFYELYEEDAAIGHREFDLKLTDRVKMKMVGVPEASFDFWASKFLAQGYKVGRVDQCETALGAEMRIKDGKARGGSSSKAVPAGKAIVRRELKSVLTTGTIVDGSMLTDDLASHCVSIKEHFETPTSPPSFGVCVLDASTAEFSLSSFNDDGARTQIETLVRQLKPKEIIHQKGNLSVATLRLLRSCLSIDCQWTALKEGTEFLRSEETKVELRKLFKGAKGDEGEMEVDDEEEVVPEKIRSMYDKPVAMSALGGMIWYLRQLNLDSDLVTNRNFNIYDPLSSGRALVLDGQTLAHIEVLQNSLGGTEGTLFQLLSRCITPFGKRLFKIWLCAPLRDVQGINDRLDAVEDLMKNGEFGAEFDKTGKKLPDLERMLSRIHAKSCKKSEFLKVLKSFHSISSTLKTLSSLSTTFTSTGIPTLLRSSPDIETLLEEIDDLYDGEELLPVDGKDEDYERVKENVERIEQALEEQLDDAKKLLKCKDLIFKDIGTKDIFQIQVPVKFKAPNSWTKMSSTKDFNRYWSPEVTKLVQELKEARERLGTVVNDFQFRVYAEFDKDYSVWLDVIKIFAELDCLLSLSKSSLALGEPSVRPEIVESEQAVIEFEELRHPCVFSATTDFIPNDVSLGGETEQMILLTGPNMAGKSTLLRMTCAAIIMAQLGCYVPASKARLAPVDAIYSRMGANDFIFANASTFKVEMDDCNKILTKATPRSLVILDELGRGTSTYDGMAIAYAVLHRLATHVGCVGFFATHFTSLTEDFAHHPEIRLCNMSTQVDDATKAVVFLYKLIKGSSPKSYGPHVASMAGLPDTLVDRAIAISKQFETTSRAREREMRANETLPLTLQADAAFLIRFAKLGIEFAKLGEKGQLKRTMEIIRKQIEGVKIGGAEAEERIEEVVKEV